MARHQMGCAWWLSVWLCAPAVRSMWVGVTTSATGAGRASRVGLVNAVLSQPPFSGFAAGDDSQPPRPRRVRLPSMPMNDSSVASTMADGYVFGRESVEAALEALQAGGMVLLTEDGEDNTEGSLVVSPSHVTAAQLQFFIDHTVRLQIALEPERYRAVYSSLHRITLDNNNLAHPAISVSARGVGVSPRNGAHIAKTVHALMADGWAVAAEASPAPGDERPSSAFSSLVCPGAVSLMCAREGGVLRRAGATEASIALAKFAGLPAVGLHASLRASGLAALRSLAAEWRLPMSSTADLVAYARTKQMLVERCGPPARMPTKHGRFVAHTYRSRVDGTEHIALVKAAGAAGEAGGSSQGRQRGGQQGEQVARDGEMVTDYPLRPFDGSSRPALVRVHSECCTGDVFGSLRCDCGEQLEAALREIEKDGHGVLLYLRGQEGRGIGLGAKMHAYALQERGVDTLDANLELGLPIDSREYGTGAQILADLGIHDIRLMSNNPKKFTGLAGYGLRIVERVPSLSVPNPDNIAYLKTKRQRMGHMYTLDPQPQGLGVGGGGLGASEGGEEAAEGATAGDIVMADGAAEGDDADDWGRAGLDESDEQRGR